MSIRAFAVTAALLCAPAAFAVPSPLTSDEPYRYQVVETSLGEALQDFGSNLGFSVSVDPGVSGTVRGPLPEETARSFLDRLARQFNFAWYFDGQVLYVTAAGQNETRLLALDTITPGRLTTTLKELGLFDPRYPVRSTDNSDVAVVSGPPRYIALVEATLQTMSGQSDEPVREPAIASTGEPAALPQEKPGIPLTVFRGSTVTVYPSGRPQ